MSSVLDIKYKKTKYFNVNSYGLLGGSAYFEGITRNNRFSYLVGLRNKITNIFGANGYSEHKPNFTDFQIYFKYQIKDYWRISFPIYRKIHIKDSQNRDTEFGTLNEI